MSDLEWLRKLNRLEGEKLAAEARLRSAEQELDASEFARRELQTLIGLVENEQSDEPKPHIKFYDDPTQFMREMAARIVVDRDKMKHALRAMTERGEAAERQLAECYRLTGADPDGNEDWRLAGHAVSEVKATRAENDALSDLVDKLTQERDRLRAALEGLREKCQQELRGYEAGATMVALGEVVMAMNRASAKVMRDVLAALSSSSPTPQEPEP